MKVFPVKQPLDGEQVVGLSPEMGDIDLSNWRRRVNNFSGRTLTHTALRSEQSSRSGRIAALGQMRSPGVIDGLFADRGLLIDEDGITQDCLKLSAGHALHASGEVITINRPQQLLLRDLPVYAPVSLLNDDENADDASDAGGLLVRRLGPTLGAAIDAELALPRAAILVLQPVRVEMNLEQVDDPCALDADGYAYENWQVLDGARLVLYSWPEEVINLPGAVTSPLWRNQLAWNIFNYEKDLPAGSLMPWEPLGVAIGLAGFDTDWNCQFIDRNAVRRAGGKRRRSASLLPDIGNHFLFQARFEQFNEQLVEELQPIVDAGGDLHSAAQHFRYLPPVGVLPKEFIDFTTRQHNFFPLSWVTEALPVPYEQLDLVVRDSASLSAFDFNRADRIQLLVPVPQVYYHPDLLRLEAIDLEFNATIARYVQGRNEWLGRRLEIRRKAAVINQTMIGKPLSFNALEPAAQMDELAAPFETALVDYGDKWRYLKGKVAPPDNWQNASFNDITWNESEGGFGYGNINVGTTTDDMPDQYVSVFLRHNIEITDPDTRQHYNLQVLTNGGFVASLNGKEIARHNLTSDNFDSLADAVKDTAVVDIDLQSFHDAVTPGNNLLAIQAHSTGRNAAEFIISPRLVELQYVPDLEADDFNVVANIDDDGLVILENGVPDYETEAYSELSEFFLNRKYTDRAGEEQLIWAADDQQRFAKIPDTGLDDFIDFLQARVNNANDKIDYGFIRLRTDIYRVRQFVLGNENATKLATSPVLAGIARGETAIGTREEIAKAADLLSQKNTMQTMAMRMSSAPGSDTGGTGATRGSDSDGLSATVIFPTMAALDPLVREGGDLFMSGDFSNIDKNPRAGKPGDELISIERGFPNTGGRGIDIKLPSNEEVSKLSNSSGSLLFGGGSTGVEEIEGQLNIIGSYPSFKNVTVGERLEAPISENAITASRATRIEAIQGILSTGISMDGINIPGFKDDKGSEISLPFADISAGILNDLAIGKFDSISITTDDSGNPIPILADDETFKFNNSIRHLEHATSLLRLTESRVKTYKLMIERCQQSLKALGVQRKNMDRRLKFIADELAEARHDVAVSRALRAEELERLDGINAQRQAVLAEQVPFLMFRRPRLADTLVDTPVHDLLPDLSDAPLPLCDIDENETPEEIAAMMEVVREAPLKWFEFSDNLIRRINRLSDMRQLLKSARARALGKSVSHRLLGQKASGLNLLALGIQNSLGSTTRLVNLQRQQTARLPLEKYINASWEENRRQAPEVISLGDIIDGNHGRMGASKKAAAELDQISRVCVCLYLHFADVLPSIRLDWAEQLSQYDAPLNLSNLFSLPRWSEIDYIERNDMQRLTDWLYNRIDSRYSDAVKLVNELLRICILLASHAPTGQLISGLVPEPISVKVGSKVNILADLTRVRIGMNIAMMSGSQTIARGTVADITGDQVQAHIVSTFSTMVALGKNTRVQIGEPRATGGMAYQKSPYLFK